MITTLTSCRACGSTQLQSVFDLGHQAVSGLFPRPGDPVLTGPLRLVRCSDPRTKCGLLQLAHTYDLNQLYGRDYGYRSGLNPTMVRHLQEKVLRIRELVRPRDGDLIVDTGSNDSTTLQAWAAGFDLVGIDPTGAKFGKYYPPHVRLIPDFFPSAAARQPLGGRQARGVTP